MVLTKDEYIEEKNKFYECYHDEITAMLKEKKEAFLKEEMKYVTVGEFFKKYLKSVIFILFVSLLGWSASVISFKFIAVFLFLSFIVFSFVYDEWKNDMKRAALHAYYNEAQSLVGDFVYQKMLEDVNESRIGIDFEKKVQFYSIAIYDFPRTFYVNVYDL